jgi:RNA polymerase sigma-70 factor, ECF subfamily
VISEHGEKAALHHRKPFAISQLMTMDSEPANLDSARRARLAEALVQTGQGDRNAFATVYAATSAKLFGVCLRIFPDRNEAEDVLQDAYLTIWNKAASFESGRASPISWLVAVTRNRAIDRLRAKKKAGTTSIDDAAEIADAAPLADAQLIEQADDRILHDCISSLDQRDAMFIKSAFIGGSTYADLAKNEGQPLGTVKSRIRRALLKLRGCMEGAA